MAHPNARLTPATRLELVLEVEAGWSQAEVARRFRVSRATVAKWWRRYREEGAAGLRDRSSAPRSNPRRTAAALEQRICAVRRGQGFGRHRLGVGIARSTAYAVLRRFGLNRLDRLHRVTRAVVRYEHPAPGDLLHIDVKKLGRIPEGGGHRVRGRSARTPRTRGLDYLHVAVDDHRAYVAALPDERGPSCAAFLEQALAAFGRRGVRVRGVLTDNAKVYTVSGDFRRVAAGWRGTAAHPALPPADQRQGRALHPTLQNEWAYARPYRSNAERLHQLPRWLYRSMLAGHTAASAGLSPPHACKQRSWEEQLACRCAVPAVSRLSPATMRRTPSLRVGSVSPATPCAAAIAASAIPRVDAPACDGALGEVRGDGLGPGRHRRVAAAASPGLPGAPGDLVAAPGVGAAACRDRAADRLLRLLGELGGGDQRPLVARGREQRLGEDGLRSHWRLVPVDDGALLALGRGGPAGEIRPSGDAR